MSRSSVRSISCKAVVWTIGLYVVECESQLIMNGVDVSTLACTCGSVSFLVDWSFERQKSESVILELLLMLGHLEYNRFVWRKSVSVYYWIRDSIIKSANVPYAAYYVI